MSKIQRFEDIQAWARARELTRKVYQVTNSGEFARDFGLRDQIRRAAVSIMSNIAEGFERRGDKEFVHFLYIAKGSCGEVRAQLYVASDQSYMSEVVFREMSEQCIEISKMIAGLISYLKKTAVKRSKPVP